MHGSGFTRFACLKATLTHRKGTFAEDDDVHVERLEVGWTVGILVKRSKTDKIVVSEEFNLLTRLFHLNIFSRQGMNSKDLTGEEKILEFNSSWMRGTGKALKI